MLLVNLCVANIVFFDGIDIELAYLCKFFEYSRPIFLYRVILCFVRLPSQRFKSIPLITFILLFNIIDKYLMSLPIFYSH